MDRDTVVRLAEDAGFIKRASFNHEVELSRFASLVWNLAIERAAKEFDGGIDCVPFTRARISSIIRQLKED